MCVFTPSTGAPQGSVLSPLLYSCVYTCLCGNSQLGCHHQICKRTPASWASSQTAMRQPTEARFEWPGYVVPGQQHFSQRLQNQRDHCGLWEAAGWGHYRSIQPWTTNSFYSQAIRLLSDHHCICLVFILYYIYFVYYYF